MLESGSLAEALLANRRAYGVAELANLIGCPPNVIAQRVRRGRLRGWTGEHGASYIPEPDEELACGPVWLPESVVGYVVEMVEDLIPQWEVEWSALSETAQQRMLSELAIAHVTTREEAAAQGFEMIECVLLGEAASARLIGVSEERFISEFSRSELTKAFPEIVDGAMNIARRTHLWAWSEASLQKARFGAPG